MKYIFSIVISFLMMSLLQAQNVGIGTTDPKAKLDINGDLILESATLTIPDGTNNQVDVNTNKFNQYKLVGPTSNFQIAGITAAEHDRTVALYNRTGVSLEVYNDDATALPQDRILTGTGGTFAVYNGGNVVLKYDTTITKWEIISSHYSSLDYFGGSWAGSANDIYNTNSGNVGIGTNSPLEKLSVAGNVDITGDIKTSGTAGQTGDVLQNNGNGTMSWMPLTQNQNGSVGYGTWGCSMDNLSEYNPILTSSDGIGCFGTGVIVQGTTAIIGAPCTSINGHNDQGCAFIFRFNGENWVEEQKIIAADGLANDYFGNAVTIKNDWAIISAFEATIGGIYGIGAVYIFHYDGTTWTQTQKLFNPLGSSLGLFGSSLAFDGLHIAIGNILYNSGFGAVDIYGYDGTQWIVQNLIVPNNNTAFHFGSAVSIDNNSIMIGCPGENGFNSSEGGVYFYHFDGSDWIFQQKFYYGTFAAQNTMFGSTVSLSGDNAVAGSPSGKLEFFRQVNGVWQANRYFSGINSFMVSVSGDYALINGIKIFRATPSSWLLFETAGDPENAFNGALFNTGSINNGRFVMCVNEQPVTSGRAIFGKIKE